MPPSARSADYKARRKHAFLEAYAKIGTVVGAAAASGVAPRTHYKWLQTVPAYAKLFAAAEEEAIERLEQEARRRALVGVDEPIYYKGQQVGTVKKHSDALLIFLLKAKRPDVYRDNQKVEHVGENGGPISFTLKIKDDVVVD